MNDEIGDSLLAQLSVLAAEQQEAERDVEELAGRLDQAKDRLRRLSEQQIPELMDMAGVAEFTTSDGLKLKVSETIRGSIPQATAGEAFRWLEENNYGHLIKREFKIEFGRDEERWAAEFEAELKQRSRPLRHEIKRAVHPQTLGAFVRGLLEEGRDVPMDLLGVFRQRRTKVETK